ncbi:hypothetical protein [Agromyces sp. Soil535]|uniref:hypothetical protein n=1 Tax=Agromyces sp. Soil535 TaxID=1736390 RepID=UPI0007019720|nr:hypothetical protein [Agromyces sp. Soil535]KRE25822.1 hypothetical protein ASG80_21770 [Agromyces sp. Soil535]
MSDLEEPKAGVSRRTVTKAMAWSVPAIALAVPAPAYAASGGGPDIEPGVAFKLPGNSCAQKLNFPTLDPDKGYLFTFLVTNNTDKPIIIFASPAPTITTTAAGLTFSLVGTVPVLPFTLAPGDDVTLGLYANGSNSANTTFDVTATIYWGHSIPDPDNHDPIIVSWTVPSTPTPQSEGFTGDEACVPPFVPLD